MMQDLPAPYEWLVINGRLRIGRVYFGNYEDKGMIAILTLWGDDE